MITLGSLFDGLGGWCLAAVRHGVKPVWSSEIDKNCLQIEKQHFPNVKQLGDINNIERLEPVDIICAGSPCQDLSIAGARKGLEGERSGLFVRAAELVHRMLGETGGEFPKFFIWENVPGAFSSNGRRDFQAVLQFLTKANIPMPPSGRWAEAGLVRSRVCDIAWRTLDAQYWGVPQRRKKIFLVCDFRGGGRRPEVLFEPEGLRGDYPKSGGQGEEITRDTEKSTGKAVSIRMHSECSGGGKGPLIAENKSNTLATGKDQTIIYSLGHDIRHARMSGNLADTLSATDYKEPPIINAPVYAIGHDERSARITENKTDPLTASDYKQPPIVNAMVYDSHPSDSRVKNVKVAPTLNTKIPKGGSDGVLTLVYDNYPNDSRVTEAKGKVQSLSQRMGSGGGNIPLTITGGVWCIHGNIAKRGNKSRENGEGIQKDLSFTLDTCDIHAVVTDEDTDSK